MSIERVRAHLQRWNREQDVLVFDSLSATVEQAANVLGVLPARIAKTLSFRGVEQSAILVVAAGDAKIDNKRFRDTFGFKARMLAPHEVIEQTGHAIGGVCPFGLTRDLPIYLDQSMQRFDTVFPACGSSNSAIELTLKELEEYSMSLDWVDVCSGWRAESIR